MAEIQQIELSIVLRMIDGINILWGKESYSKNVIHCKEAFQNHEKN